MSDTSPLVKLVINYDIDSGAQQIYYQFMVSQFIPGLQAMGLQMSDAWHTVYGDHPSRTNGFVGLDLEDMRDVLDGQEWRDLEERLQKYVSNYSWRIIPLRDGFQL